MPSVIHRGVDQLLAEANAQVEAWSVEEARSKLGGEDVVFVDIRDIRELKREGRIPGAVHAPRGMLEFWIDPASPYHREVFAQDKTFVFFCAAGWRSALAALTAQEMGLAPVVHITGGFKAWRESGAPIETFQQKR